MLLGQPAPDFRMVTTKDLDTLEHVATPQDYRDRGKWLVMLFYPSDFTFVCPTEMIAFDAAFPEFEELDAELLGVSTDGVHAHLAWMEFHVGYLRFPLASDRTQQVSRAYDLLAPDGRSARATVVVDPEGVVRYVALHDDKVGRSVEETLRVVRALHSPGRTYTTYVPAPRDPCTNETAATV